uniref:Uncharacterized protein n=1 Tax=Anopheles farauti TaxID=69004 RepID=A0A182R1B9_9DIPT
MDVIVSAGVGAAVGPVAGAPTPSSSSLPATAPTASAVAAAIASRSLRVRTSSQSGGKQYGEALSEIQLCPSVMSEGTRKMLPPTTETIQTKPFPIRAVCVRFRAVEQCASSDKISASGVGELLHKNQT